MDKEKVLEDQLCCIGFERQNRQVDGLNVASVVSLHGGRPYSRSDSEHFLCKLWLAIIHSHQSRNLSRVKRFTNNHCYPLLHVIGWEEDIAPVMRRVWCAYERERLIRKLGFPMLLEYVLDPNKIAKELVSSHDQVNR